MSDDENIRWQVCPQCRQSFPWKRGEIPSHICPVCVGKEQDATKRREFLVMMHGLATCDPAWPEWWPKERA